MSESIVIQAQAVFEKAQRAVARRRYMQSPEWQARLEESRLYLESEEGQAALDELLNDAHGG